jgi:hypothetical protein
LSSGGPYLLAKTLAKECHKASTENVNFESHKERCELNLLSMKKHSHEGEEKTDCVHALCIKYS